MLLRRISGFAAALSICIFTCPLWSQTTGYWHTSGSKILDSNNQDVRMAGVNWYGFEGTTEVLQGLWAQDYHRVLDTVKGNGYNVIRVPFSNQMVEHPIVPQNISFTNGSGPINTDLQGLNSLQILDKMVAYAGQIGLHLILDDHRSDAGSGTENGLWYTSTYPEAAWIADWQTLASRYLNNPTVIGMDLRNEPHDANNGGACWGCGSATNDWQLGAQRGGNAVLAVNPNLLIFVEGTDCYNGDCDWWGGNLEGVQTAPVVLSVANRVVYSAHDYGPNLFVQNWFNANTTYASLVATWTKYWAYISLNGIAPVWLGEFGTTNNNGDIESAAAGSQGQWFQSLTTFLQSAADVSWTYWALDGEDSYGLLDNNYDPTPANPLKQQLLAGIQSSTGGNVGTLAPLPPSNLSASAVSSAQINLTWTASITSGATYNVYASPMSNFTPSAATRVATAVTGTTFNQQGLTASTTYYYFVTAVVAGVESVPSNGANATTAANTSGGGGTAACQVSYSIVNQWNTGFTAAVSITNSGTSAINSWTLTWTWPGNQQITQAWNGNYAQSGSSASLSNASWNGPIAPGATVTGIGFNANYNGTNVAPNVISLNGGACNGSGTPGGGTAPAAPTNLAAAGVSSSGINLSWTASTASGVTYDVYASTTAGFVPSAANRVASGLMVTNFASQNLAAGTTYYYVVTALNASGESAPSGQASATTQANPPPPPAAPSGVSATAASSNQVNLTWQPSTTPGVTYDVYGSTTPGFSPAAANRIGSGISAVTFQQTGLAAATTYYYLVTAVSSGGESTPGNQAAATTMAATGGGATCHVTYSNQNDWGSGFTGAISISNTGSTAVNGWTLSWTWPGNQQMAGAWNASATQSGQTVAFTSESYNAVISPGATLTGIGFNANYSGSNAAPTAFSFNGVPCQ